MDNPILVKKIKSVEKRLEDIEQRLSSIENRFRGQPILPGPTFNPEPSERRQKLQPDPFWF